MNLKLELWFFYWMVFFQFKIQSFKKWYYRFFACLISSRERVWVCEIEREWEGVKREKGRGRERDRERSQSDEKDQFCENQMVDTSDHKLNKTEEQQKRRNVKKKYERRKNQNKMSLIVDSCLEQQQSILGSSVHKWRHAILENVQPLFSHCHTLHY